MSSGPARYFGLLLSKERERERESWWTEISVKRETVRTFLFGGRSPETVGHKVLSSQGISRTFRIFWYLASFLALSAAALFEFSGLCFLRPPPLGDCHEECAKKERQMHPESFFFILLVVFSLSPKTF